MKLSDIQDQQIILFPISKESLVAYNILKKHNYTVNAFWDNYKSKSPLDSVPVHKPNVNDGKHCIILICSTGPFYNVFHQQCALLGCTNVYDFGEVLLYEKLDYEDMRQTLLMTSFVRNQQKPNVHGTCTIPSLEIPITDRCSLKCRHCSNLMQYFTHPQDADVDPTIRWIEQTLDAVDYIEQLRLLGGEPFVCKNLYRYVEHFKDHPKIGMIHIYSNGTILPADKNLSCLKHPKVYLSISNYGISTQKLSLIESIFQREEIFYQIVPYSDWTDCSAIGPHHRTDEQQQAVFAKCCANQLLTLRNGRIFICPFISNGWALQAIPEADTEAVIVEGHSTSEIRDAITSLRKKSFVHACDYCNGRPMGVTNIPAAEQTSAPIPYTKYGVD